jgi:acyl-coenzyme A thioesterase PaaI-like protein
MTKQRDVESIEAQIGRAFEQMIPFNRVIGLKVDSLDPKAPRLRFDMRPELVGNPVRQILHGGVISATLDVVGGLAIALASIADRAEPMSPQNFPNIGTIDLRVDYLRPGRGKYFVATGRWSGSAAASRWSIPNSSTTPASRSRPVRRPTSSVKAFCGSVGSSFKTRRKRS